MKPAPPSEPPIMVMPNRPDQGGQDGDGQAMKLVPWIVGGVGVAALAGGLVLNLSARSKMNECFDLADKKQSYESVCDAAKPRAYASYALFGVAAAAAVTDAILIFVVQKDGSQGNERHLSAAPLPGGAAVYGHFRF
jgi:hypothetical protein